MTSKNNKCLSYPVNSPVVHFLKKTSIIFSILIIALGLLTLIGYQWNKPFLKNLMAGTVYMNPATAGLFILCGITLVLLNLNIKRYKWYTIIIAGIILCLGVIKSATYLWGLNFHFDTLLFTEKLVQPWNSSPNFMAPNTAINFVFAGIAMIFMSYKKKTTSQIFSLIILLFSFFPLIGYWYNLPEFYRINEFTPIAFNTSFCFSLIGSALLFLYPQKGIMIVLSNNLMIGLTARILLPVIIIFSLLIGYYTLQWHNSGLIRHEFEIVFLVICSMFFFVGLMWGLTYYLFKIDIKKLRAEEEIGKLNSTLEEKVKIRTRELEVANKDLKITQLQLEKILKEVRDYKYAINQSSTVEITDTDGKIIFANENFCNLSKFTLEELIGQDHRMMNSGYHTKDFYKILWETINSGHTFRGEIKNKTKDGNFYWVDSVIVPFMNEAEKPYQYMVFRQDITQRKLAEEALAESSQLNKQIIKSVQDGVVVYDKSLHYMEWNPFMEQMSGIPASQVLGKYPTDLFPFLEETGVIANIKKALKGEIVTTGDFNYKIPNSTISGWAQDTNAPLKNIKGEIIGVIGTVRDITSRKNSENELLAAYHKIQLLLDSMAEGAYGVDLDGICTFVNKSFLNLLGYQNENEIIGKKIHLLMHHSYPDGKPYPAEDCKMLNSRKTKQKINVSDEVFWKKDGSPVQVEYWSYPIIRNETIIGAICTFVDITERKKIEEKLKDTINEIDTFVFRSSHDLKSPVSSLKGLLHLMKKEITDKKALDYLKMVEQNNIRMENIVSDLSSVVLIKDESRKPTMINISELIYSTIKLFKYLPDFEKIEIEIDVVKDLQFISDNILLAAICQNLIGNAIKYRKINYGHKVSISVKEKNCGILLTVSDNGEGISVNPIEKIFEMFYRGNLKSTGTGLGLYIVKKAIEKLEGKIQVESKPGKGATFRVFLPTRNLQ